MFAQDVLTRIINVNWPGHLIALEFFITSTWQPSNPFDSPGASDDTIDDKIDADLCGPPSIALGDFPWTAVVFGWKKQARWDVVLQSIQKGKRNSETGLYEWELDDDAALTGGLNFIDGHDPPGPFGEPLPDENFPVWHPPGFPKTATFDDAEVFGGGSDNWLVQFRPIVGGNYLINGNVVQSPSFGANFKSTLQATGEVRGWEIRQFEGCYNNATANPHGTPLPFFTGARTWSLTDDYVSGGEALQTVSDVLDELAIAISGIRVKRTAESTFELVPVAVAGNKDFISVLMGNPPPVP